MPGQVIAIASGKGGVGKTTTTVNIAVALRQRDKSVALVDADLGMANLATLLGFDPDTTLHDVLAGEATLADALLEEADGFAVLPGGQSLMDFAAADPDELVTIIDTLADQYEYVLVDTGAGLSYEDVSPLSIADQIILVTTPDPTAIGDTAKTRELATMVNAPIRGLVVTHTDDATDPTAIADRIGVELLGTVPRDPIVTESTTAGTPLQAYAPESQPAEAYRRLAAALTTGDDAEPTPTDATDPPASDATPAETDTPQSTADATPSSDTATSEPAAESIPTADDEAPSEASPDTEDSTDSGETKESTSRGGLLGWFSRLFS